MQVTRMPGDPRPYRPFPIQRDDIYLHTGTTKRYPEDAPELKHPITLSRDTRGGVFYAHVQQTTVTPAAQITPSVRQTPRWLMPTIIVIGGLLLAALTV